MNQRKIWFAGVVTAALGVGIGLVLAGAIKRVAESRKIAQATEVDTLGIKY